MCFTYETSAYPITDVYHRARKEHLCSDCGETITKGELYRKVVYPPDGYGLETFKVCKSCMILADRITGTELLRGCTRFDASPPIAGATEHLIESGTMPWETANQRYWRKKREERLARS